MYNCGESAGTPCRLGEHLRGGCPGELVSSAFPWAWGLFTAFRKELRRVSSSLGGESGILYVPGASYVLSTSQVRSAAFRKKIRLQLKADQSSKLQARKGVRVKWIGWGRPRELKKRKLLWGPCGVLGLWLRKCFPLLQGGPGAMQSLRGMILRALVLGWS